MLSGGIRPLLRLGTAIFFAQSALGLYGASLPLYFAALGFDQTLIGLLIGAMGIAELVAAVVVGPGIDRFGGRALLFTGAGCLLLASLGFTVFTAVPALVLLRLIQGFGLAAVIPSVYSFVPNLVKARAQTVAFASLGAGGNVAMAICPPLGILLLEGFGPDYLFLTAAARAIGMILGASGGGLLYPLLGFNGLLSVGALLCALGLVALLRDRFTLEVASVSREPIPAEL